MPPVGRPPATRGVFNFEETLVPPSELVLDSGFVAEALVTTQPRHAACQAFLQDLATAEATVVFNRLLEAELWEFCYIIALAEFYGRGRRAREARRDGRIRRRGTRLREQVADAWGTLLDAINWVVIEVDEVMPWVPQMMQRGLKSYDAIHAATAAYADVRPFVTLDYDFSVVPARELELYVPAHRVGVCREARQFVR